METKSYMIAIPEKSSDLENVEQIINRMSNASDMEVLSVDFDDDTGLNLTLKITGKEYLAEVYPISLEEEMTEMYQMQHLFSDIDMEAIKKADCGLVVSIEFNEEALESYHAQLKIIGSLLPKVAAVIDESSQKILSGRWVKLAAESNVPPAPRYIYTVQAISGEDDNVWLHSHGLNRCGLPELEILNSTKDTYQSHYNIIETMANRLLELEEPLEEGEPFYLARVTEDIPMFTTLIDWEEAVSHYPDNMPGGKQDREEDHNEDTCAVFVYTSPENIDKRRYSEVSVFDEFLEENPLYMISNKETERMKRLAAERLPYLFEAVKDERNAAILKIGLEMDEEFREEDSVNLEHIWFELLEVKGEMVRCKLTQEPYYVKNMHKESEGIYSIDKITDWLLYTPERRYSPDDVYLFN